jgi:hypothetical protein
MRNRIRLTEAAVRACFENHTHQADVLIAIYRLVFPDWDDIAQLDSWPAVNARPGRPSPGCSWTSTRCTIPKSWRAAAG